MSNGPTEKQQQQHRSSIDDIASIINQIMTKLSFENVGEFSGPSQRTLRVSQEVLGMEKDRMGHSWTRGSCQASGCSCCQPQDLASNEGFRSHETRNEPCWKQAFRNWNGGKKLLYYENVECCSLGGSKQLPMQQNSSIFGGLLHMSCSHTITITQTRSNHNLLLPFVTES